MRRLLEDERPSGRIWQMRRRVITVRGVRRQVRLVRFSTAWLASVDTESGPTLGADRSPYLAVHLSLEPLGIELAESLIAVGPIAPE